MSKPRQTVEGRSETPATSRCLLNSLPSAGPGNTHQAYDVFNLIELRKPADQCDTND